jgi:branched-chain amino acid transport system ATP-binding protein
MTGGSARTGAHTTSTGLHLELCGVHAGYGPADVLHGIDLEVKPGEAVAVLGPNGAGKSTIVKVVMGVVGTRAGGVSLDGALVRRFTPRAAVAAGISVVPEGRRVFPSESIADNLRIGGWANRRARSKVLADCERMYERFPILGDRRKHLAASLSGGEAQMLAIAMALMARPRLVVLDEPTLGLAPLIVDQIMDEIAELRSQGVSVLLVEQNVRKALKVVDRAYVLSLGVVQMHGSAEEVRTNADVRRAYLGSGAERAATAAPEGDDGPTCRV